jgi:hypothetical protein
MKLKIKAKTHQEILKSYYERNKDASNVYIEGKTACKTGQTLEDNPYKDMVHMSELGPIFQNHPFYIHWEQGFLDEVALINELVKIAAKYYTGDEGE